MIAAKTARLYFDNAATSFPKPPGVAEAVVEYLLKVGASAGRGAYREALQAGKILEDCRSEVRKLFGCGADEDVIFTFNGTDALNLAIKGVVRPGDHVVTTRMDHNSVLRPLAALQQRLGIEWTAAAVDPRTTRVDPDQIVSALRTNTRLVVVAHASNVTGALQPIEQIARVCRERGVFFLVDAAQTAGHVPIDMRRTAIDLLACPGHKGLLGPLGTGVLVLRRGMAARLATLREGGTGSESESYVQPDTPPDKFEPGSHNTVGLAGLLAAVRWILERGTDALRVHEKTLCSRMITRLNGLAGVRRYGPDDVQQRVGVFSVRVMGLAPDEVAALLEERYGILTRSGLHCAPLAHETLRTRQTGGTTRFSFGPFLQESDIDLAAAALAELVKAARAEPVIANECRIANSE